MIDVQPSRATNVASAFSVLPLRPFAEVEPMESVSGGKLLRAMVIVPKIMTKSWPSRSESLNAQIVRRSTSPAIAMSPVTMLAGLPSIGLIFGVHAPVDCVMFGKSGKRIVRR